MAYYGRDYDRGGWGDSYYGSPAYNQGGGYRPGYGGQSGNRYGYRTGAYGYDRNFSRGTGGGYDRNYKSRWQTDHGDPFGDRSRGTPIRMLRGEFENENRDRSRWGGYDRGDYRTWADHGRYDRGRYDRGRYDSGWW